MAEPRLGLADIALTEGNTQEAIVQVEAYLKIKPDDVQGKKIAYTAYLRAGQQDKAKAISAELGDAKLNAGLAIDLYNQGALASQKNDFDTALAKFKEATDYDANLAEAWAGMGSVLYNQGKFAEALTNAEKALALKPTLQPAMRSRFLALDGLKRKQEAGVAWDAYAAIDKNGALDLLIRSAEADFKDGNLEAAEASLLRVLELNPDDPQAHLQIGLVYASSNPPEVQGAPAEVPQAGAQPSRGRNRQGHPGLPQVGAGRLAHLLEYRDRLRPRPRRRSRRGRRLERLSARGGGEPAPGRPRPRRRRRARF